MKNLIAVVMMATCAVALGAVLGNDASAGALPPEYQEVEYVESTGSQFIDTGYKPNGKTTTTFKYRLLKENQNRNYVVGYCNSEAVCRFQFSPPGSGTVIGYDNWYTLSPLAGIAKDDFLDHTVTMGPDGLFYDDDEKPLTTFSAWNTANESRGALCIFGNRIDTGTPSNLSSIRLYYFRILENGEVKHEYVPCYLRSDATRVGFYDTVGNAPYMITGLVKGEDVYRTGVFVSGNPRNCATAADAPQYGRVECAVDETFSMTVPASFVEKDGRSVGCLGWKLYDYETDELVKESDEQNKLTCEFTYSTPVKLVWQWNEYSMLTVQNFDDDLATVWVNDAPTTNGQQVAVSSSVKIELKDFRNDYYFRFAPASQTDRTLALDCWEGVPAGYEKENPATFDVTGDLTITPNVDVKGYCWEYQEVGDVKQLTNDVYRWAWVKWVDANRTVLFGPCIEPVVPATENNLVVDFIERVRCNGKNYQVSTFSLANRVYAFTNSRAGTWAVPPRFSSFGTNLMGDSGFCITNVVGFYDIESCVVGDAPFSHAGAAFSGPATNFVPRNATSFGNYPYQSKTGMTGEVLMEKVTSIGSKCFYGCSGLTSLRITSPNLKSIANIAFAACTKMKDVTFAGSLANLTSIDASAFQSVVVTNFNFLVAPPASKTPLDNMLAQTTAGDGAHACRLTVDSSIAAWWALTAAPTEAELGVGLPENFMGVYVSDAGDRRAWIVSSTPVGGILLVGDMSMEGNAGFVPRTGLEIGSKLELKAPDGYDQCQLQHFVDGQWRTDKTISGTTVDYEHDGQLTRAVWSVDGAKLTKKVNGYGGAIDVTVVSGKEISEGIYEKGSVVRLTASGAAEHPTSHFAGWTKGIDAAQAGTATVEVTLDTDVEVTADFSPDEWIYTKSNATSGTLTDGEWTMTATKTDGELTINSASGGQNGVLWLDLALPVHDSENMEANYPITVLNCSPVNMRKMRVAPHFRAITAGPFMPNSTVLERIDGLGASQMTSFGYAFLYECGKCPLRTTVYEANDFVPPGLLTVVSSLSGVPYLTGTYELNAVTCLYKAGSINFQLLNDRLYYGTVDGHVVGVTNILLTTEGLQEIPDGIFGNARVEAVTIGSTNLTTTGTSAFKNYNGAFRSLTFLAHAPTVAALDNLVKVAATTNLTVYCSKFAPGWKDLRTKGYSTMEEWAARPAGCWGIYQTADGKKRYYLVQKDSKYDKRNGFAVILK